MTIEDAEQALSVLEVLDRNVEYVRVARIAGGKWRVVYLSNADWKTSGQCDGATLIDALAQVAQVLSLDESNERNG